MFTEFVYPWYDDFDSPSISGLDAENALLLWHGPQESIYGTRYENGTWSKVEGVGAGRHPSVSVSNPPGRDAFFVYAGTQGPPYALLFGGPESMKPNGLSPKATASALRQSGRRIVLSSRTRDESLSLDIECPVLENSSDSLLTFVPVDDTVRYTPQEIFSLMETPAYNMRNSELPLRIKHTMHGVRARTVRNPLLNTPILLQAVHAGTNAVLAQEVITPAVSDTGTTLSGVVRLRPNLASTTPVKFRIWLPGAVPQQCQAAVVNVYRMGQQSTGLFRMADSEKQAEIPRVYALHQNYPNPFNPSTTIKYDLPEPSHVSLVIYDVLGRKVVELENGVKDAGYHNVQCSTDNGQLSSGVYFARFVATDANGSVKLSKVNKLLLTK